ncbi:MAG: prephenate dehydrogenase/arogenate dehydrogenase family protein, partial [Clostridium sp.]|nr:prephenate dehydrogenase/arogenate dehydrogenase family protein [Clostridium sp.]
ALPVTLGYKEHDYITGTISHLPHIIASSLVNFVKASDTEEEWMKHLAAGGFKDITRIASSSPTMWQHICSQNRENITQILTGYIQLLTEAKEQIAAGDEQAVYGLFDSSRNYRNSIPDSSSGPIKKAYVVYCDIIDEAGGIAAIATILASNHLSIKNIGIIHNREFEEGVLRIEFYEEDSSKKASLLLQKYRYIVYER